MQSAVIVSVILCGLFSSESHACGRPAISPFADNLIVGGSIARKGSWPWQVSIGMRQQLWFGASCGGSILDQYHVLTAAHCVTNPDFTRYVIRAGKHDRTVFEASESSHEIRRITVHPSYGSASDDHDIAVVEVQTPFRFSVEIGAVCLPMAGSDPAVNTLAIASGWGETNPQDWKSDGRGPSSLLKQVTLPIIQRSTCAGYYPGLITNNMVCAGYEQGGQDACQADSGGPLVQRSYLGAYELVGVTSWGWGCGMARQPGVFTRTSLYISWIYGALKR